MSNGNKKIEGIVWFNFFFFHFSVKHSLLRSLPRHLPSSAALGGLALNWIFMIMTLSQFSKLKRVIVCHNKSAKTTKRPFKSVYILVLAVLRTLLGYLITTDKKCWLTPVKSYLTLLPRMCQKQHINQKVRKREGRKGGPDGRS